MIERTEYPTSDERVLAGISHLLGLLVALIIWATQKDKSPFVRFQAMQALAFDLAVVVASFAIVGCMMFTVFGTMMLSTGGMIFLTQIEGQEAALPWLSVLFGLIPMASPLTLMCPIFLLASVTLIIRVIVAVNAFQGRDFHYPWLGQWVERLLANNAGEVG